GNRWNHFQESKPIFEQGASKLVEVWQAHPNLSGEEHPRSTKFLRDYFQTGKGWCAFNPFAMLAVRIFDKRLEFVRLPKRFSKAFRRSQAGSLASVQPLHVIAHAVFERKLRLVF